MSAQEAYTINDNHLIADENGFLLSYYLDDPSGHLLRLFIEDNLSEWMYDELKYVDGYIHITDIRPDKVTHVRDTVEECFNRVVYTSTVVMVDDYTLYSDDPILCSGEPLGTGRLSFEAALNELDEQGGLWAVYAERAGAEDDE
jgi:hypothetical protein